MHMKPSDETE